MTAIWGPFAGEWPALRRIENRAHENALHSQVSPIEGIPKPACFNKQQWRLDIIFLMMMIQLVMS
jgi:hypothetical protein